MALEAAESQENESVKTDIEVPSISYNWKILAFGQVLSFLLATMWASQSTLFLNCDWSSPAFSCAWAYLLLSFHMIPLFLKGLKIRQGTCSTGPSIPAHWFLNCFPLQTSPWIYFGMGLLSFYGNYFSLIAIRFTTLTRTSIFDAMAVPTAMLLSHFFLGRRYLRLHMTGAALCLMGLLLNAGVDLVSNLLYREAASEVQALPGGMNATEENMEEDDGAEEYPHKIIGDVMACLGGILFGANDVMAEFTVRRHGAGSTEYLAMIGFFGVLISMVQSAISERSQIIGLFHGTAKCGGNAVATLLVLYVIGQFSRKAGLANFLTVSDAAFLSLSLLTSDLYAAFFSMIYQQIFPRPLFWVSMLLVVIGIVLFESGKSPITDDQKRIGMDRDGLKTVDVEVAVGSRSKIV